MTEEEVLQHIAKELDLNFVQVRKTVKLLDGGNTIPFITRYRKEAIGELDEVQIRAIAERLSYMRTLEERKSKVLASVEEQGKLTSELAAEIAQVTKLQDLEDLYLPYRPKKRTRGMVAREKGLEPLANRILSQPVVDGTLEDYCAPYIDPGKGLENVDKVLQGALDIVAEIIAENGRLRKIIRELTMQQSILHSTARNLAQYSEYQMYYHYSEQAKKISPHRIFAINRGEKEGLLKVQIKVPIEEMLSVIEKRYVKSPSSVFFYQMKDAIRDAYKRLIAPSIEREIRTALTETAEDHAVEVFSENLRRLLLLPPVRDKRIMGIDPGYVSGSKIAVIDETGEYLAGDTIYPHAPHKRTHHAKKVIKAMIKKHKVDVIAIGNGTASRETEQLIADIISELPRKVIYTIVNEAGASVYSTSKTAQREFPNLDASMRGNISIARRLLDPLAEWVKIDPRSIGVGLYQHDILPKRLTASLETVIESCVNYVGVDLNTASASLLKYVAGITGRAAQNIVRFRNKYGPFTSRTQLLEVNDLGKVAYQQAAGFLRISGGDNPLDHTPIHPESYKAAEALLKYLKLDIASIGRSHLVPVRLLLKNVDLSELAAEFGLGLPTLEDILSTLEKPGRDPRDDLPKPLFRSDILKIEDLKEGMRLRGTVRNVVDFGAFVDIGIKDDALVHISEMSHQFVKSPFDVVSVGDDVEVKILSIDRRRRRVALSMKL